MYLYKKTYVKNWDYMSDDQKHEIIVKKGGVERTDIKSERISTIVEQVGYWRKFNALHQWFVDNIQDKKDDCEEYYVNANQLKNLLNDLIIIKDNHSLAEDLLHTQEGFFFGDTDYGDWYFQEIHNTIEFLEELLEEDNKGDFYYQSSW